MAFFAPAPIMQRGGKGLGTVHTRTNILTSVVITNPNTSSAVTGIYWILCCEKQREVFANTCIECVSGTHCKRRAKTSKSIAGSAVVLVGGSGRFGAAHRGDAASRDVVAHGEHVAEGGGEVSPAQAGYLGKVVAIALARVGGGGKEEGTACSFTSENDCYEAAKTEKDVVTLH